MRGKYAALFPTHSMTQTGTNHDDLLFKCLTFLFYLFVFFPYLAIMPLGSDTQPNAFVVGALIIAFAGRHLSLPSPIWALGLVALMAAALFLLNPLSFSGARSLFGYLSLFVVSAATYVCVRNGHPLSKGFLYFVVLSWLFLGLLQLTIDASIGNALLSAARTSEERGAVSFAAEPGYYGSMMFFVLLVLMARKQELSVLALLCTVQIILIAQSSVVVAALLAPIFVYVLLKGGALLKNPYFVSALVVLFVLAPQIADYLEDSRVTSLFLLVLDNPSLLLLADASGNQRAASIFFSLKGALDNNLLPRGFDAYYNYIASVSYEYRNIFWAVLKADRIMSGYGAAFFELGIFGLTIPVVIAMAIFRHFPRSEWQRAIVLNVGVHAVMFTAIPFALPVIGFFIGHLLATPAERTTAISSASGPPSALAAKPV